jgi:hypothetical protein
MTALPNAVGTNVARPPTPARPPDWCRSCPATGCTAGEDGPAVRGGELGTGVVTADTPWCEVTGLTA